MKDQILLPVLTLMSVPFLADSCATGGKADHKDQRMNIIHIMCDDHSFQTISAYGHPISALAPTPNIDRLAHAGTLFNNAYVENSLSTPSRACLMTGLYSHQNGQRFLTNAMDSTKLFFTELLQENGYQTGIVGKWHITCQPKGFDYYSILYDQGDYYAPEFKTKESGGKYIREEGYATDKITDHALEFLENRDQDRPFCLMVHHKAPHRNWMPDIKYLDLYEDVEFPYPDTFMDDYSTRTTSAHSQKMSIDKDMTMSYDLKVDELSASDAKSMSAHWKRILKRFTPEQLEAWMANYHPKNERFIAQNLKGEELVKWKYQRYIKDYVRVIKSIDDQVGRILDYLEENDLMDNTMIVYTSDQGFYMGEHGWFDKRFMYEESFRTPLIVYYPKAAPEMKTCDQLVQNIDYAPTFLDLAGIEIPEEMVGRSLLPLLEGAPAKDWRKDLYYHYYDKGHHVCRHDGVRDERYKLIHFYGPYDGKVLDDNEFYDLKNDPNELHNLYGDKAYSKEVQRLQKRLDEYREELEIDEY